MSSIFSKTASRYPFFSIRFVILYGLMILTLGIYAVFWQQIIKMLPLTLAFANKAITVVWGMVWGVIFFQERITAGKIIGASIVIAGIILFVQSEGDT